MKTNQLINLLTLGLASVSMTSLAQTSPATNSAGNGQYRQSSTANGTAINNSNSTNYNSNNVTNAPTGVGSNPSVSTNPSTLNGGSSTVNSPSGSSGNAGSSSSSSVNNAPKTGTGAAVTGARNAPAPAVVAGSTERNTSLHGFIASSPNYTTLQNALQSAELYNSLKEGGPYTLFAPSNSAFKKLPASAQASLLEGRNHDVLRQLVSYHFVEGQLNTAELTKQIKANGGKAQLRTIEGDKLTVQLGSGGRLTLTDQQGKTAVIDAPDNRQANGVVHGIDAVLMPANANSIR